MVSQLTLLNLSYIRKHSSIAWYLRIAIKSSVCHILRSPFRVFVFFHLVFMVHLVHSFMRLSWCILRIIKKFSINLLVINLSIKYLHLPPSWPTLSCIDCITVHHLQVIQLCDHSRQWWKHCISKCLPVMVNDALQTSWNAESVFTNASIKHLHWLPVEYRVLYKLCLLILLLLLYA